MIEGEAKQPDYIIVPTGIDSVDVYTSDGVSSVDLDGLMGDGDAGLRGQALVDYWDVIGTDKGPDGFYNQIREKGCTSCGCHSPGNCDGCA